MLGNDNITQGISNYVDEILFHFVTTLPSYLRDTKDAVTRLQDIHVTATAILASLDVEELYTLYI